VISQSGETADTIAAQREAKAKGSQDAGHLQRGGIDDYARSRGNHLHPRGPEIGVASTKAFTCQLTALYLVALYLAQVRGTMTADKIRKQRRNLRSFPASWKRCLHAR
jgi:glutamine---fructose-6-phosphate transaminase (isomerizing)